MFNFLRFILGILRWNFPLRLNWHSDFYDCLKNKNIVIANETWVYYLQNKCSASYGNKLCYLSNVSCAALSEHSIFCVLGMVFQLRVAPFNQMISLISGMSNNNDRRHLSFKPIYMYTYVYTCMDHWIELMKILNVCACQLMHQLNFKRLHYKKKKKN